MIASVGDDPFGQSAINALAQEAIHVEHIHLMPDTPTGVALVTVDRNGENTISLAPGANERLSPAHIDAAESCLSSADMILIQLEIPFETVLHSLRVAKRLEKPVLLNPAPARELGPEVLAMIDTLVVNTPEAAILCKHKLKTLDDLQQAAYELSAKGVPRVVISMGAKGAVYLEKGQFGIQASFPVSPVDTTGAGDTLCGALALRLASGESLASAMQFASAAASISVSKPGAQKSAPERLAIMNFLELHGNQA